MTFYAKCPGIPSSPLSGTYYSNVIIKGRSTQMVSPSQINDRVPPEEYSPDGRSTVIALTPPHRRPRLLNRRPQLPLSRFHFTSAGLLLNVTSPPKQLLVSRLTYCTTSDDILVNIGTKINSTRSHVLCVKLLKHGFSDRVIASFKVTYPHDFNAIPQSSFWNQGVFIKPYQLTKLRESFRTAACLAELD